MTRRISFPRSTIHDPALVQVLDVVNNNISNRIETTVVEQSLDDINRQLAAKVPNETLSAYQQQVNQALQTKAAADAFSNFQQAVSENLITKASTEALSVLQQNVVSELGTKVATEDLEAYQLQLDQVLSAKATNQALTNLNQSIAQDLTLKATLTENVFEGTQTAPAMRAQQYISKTVTIPAASGVVRLDLSAGDLFEITLAGNITLELDNIPEMVNDALGFIVRVTQPATAFTMGFFANTTWIANAGASPGAPAANKIIEYLFTSKDGVNFVGRKGAAT
jgi:hypothetical protein